MYLSLLHVNVDNEPGRQWLGNLYRVHQRLWMAFPDHQQCISDPFFLASWNGPPLGEPKPKREKAGFLFRIERDGPARILVQSAEEADWEYAFQNAGHLLAGSVAVRPFDPVPCEGRHYRFRLLANVVDRHSVPRSDGRTTTTRSGRTFPRRKRHNAVVLPSPMSPALPVDVAERKRVVSARWDTWRDWLAKMGERAGFRVLNDRSAPLLVQAVHAIVRNPKWAEARRYNAGLFDGILECADAERLRTAIINGIGPAKAYGFGLLSVVPLRGA